jgi:hypothetical protein
MANGFTWSHDPVAAGATVTVKVSVAPCNPVTVTLLIDGNVVDHDEVGSPPGSTTVDVPSGSSGSAWEIRVSCNGRVDSQSGVVA